MGLTWSFVGPWREKRKIRGSKKERVWEKCDKKKRLRGGKGESLGTDTQACNTSAFLTTRTIPGRAGMQTRTLVV
jgi:hypothetical protein